MWKNSTQIVTKLELELWQNLKPIILQNWKISNWYNSKSQIVTKPKLWESSKTQIVTKHKNSNCDKTQNSNSDKTLNLKSWQLNSWQNFKKSFSKNNLTPWQRIKCTLETVLRSRNVFFCFFFHVTRNMIHVTSETWHLVGGEHSLKMSGPLL